MDEDLNQSQQESQEKQARRCASMYLSQIATWQSQHGGFRRLPRRASDVRLNNWVQRCRFNYRHGMLDQSVAEQLVALGVIAISADADVERIAEDVFTRAIDGVQLVESLAQEREGASLAQAKDREKVARLMVWLDEIKRLKRAGRACVLLEDLQRMIPITYAREVELVSDAIARREAAERKEMGALESTFSFVSRTNRLPDILSIDERERSCASWLIQVEKGLISAEQVIADKGARAEEMMVKLSSAIASASVTHRDAQWRWWSQVAMDALRTSGFSQGGQERVWKDAPEIHAERLDLNVANAKVGRPGWEGGPWGIDVVCVQLGLEKAAQGIMNPGAVIGMSNGMSGGGTERAGKALVEGA